MSETAPAFLMDDEAREQEAPTNTELAEISKLAKQQQDLERLVSHIENELATAKENLRKIAEIALPEAMAQVGMKTFALEDGASISIKEEVYPSIRVDHINSAVKWLESIKCGGSVKDEIKISLGTGELEKAKQIIAFAKGLGCSPSEKLGVNAQTLKALVKEQRAKGVVFPEEYFSIADKKFAIIKTPK